MSNKLERGLFFFLFKWQRGKCYLCGIGMEARTKRGRVSRLTDYTATVDHIVSKQVANFLRSNSALAHRACNHRKKDRMPKACEIFYASEMWRAAERAGM